MTDDIQRDECENADRLDSWKEIASYLNRDIRTVQRWERAEGLPVQRHAHGQRGSVYACKSDIDAWRNARQPPAPSPPVAVSRSRRVTLAAVAIAALALVGMIGTAVWRTVRPATVVQTAASPETGLIDAPRLLDAVMREGARLRTVRLEDSVYLLALAREDKDLYSASWDGGISLIDTDSLRVVRTFEARETTALVQSADQRYLYVGQSAGDVMVIDTQSKAVSHILVGGRIRGLALSTDDSTLYVAGLYSGLFAVDTSTRRVRRLSGLPCPTALARTPDGRHLYVNYQCQGPGGRAGHDAIDVIDTATNASIGAITGLPNVGGVIAISPDGSQIWADGTDACDVPQYDHAGCPSRSGGVVNVLRASDRAPIRSLEIDNPRFGSSNRLTFTPDGNRVAAFFQSGVQVFNAATLSVAEAAAIPVHGAAVFTRDRRWMYVGIGDERTIAKVPIQQRPAPPPGLSGRWTADGTANDVHGLAPGAVEGQVGYAPGYIGQAFLFGTSSGAIRVDSLGNLAMDGRPFTLALWMNLESPGGAAATIAERMMATDGFAGWTLTTTADSHLTACFSDGHSSCAANPARSVSGNATVSRGVWHHIALAWDGVSARLFLDGRPDGQAPLPGFVDCRQDPLRFGGSAGARRSFSGRLDEIEVYERALAPAEIASRASVSR